MGSNDHNSGAIFFIILITNIIKNLCRYALDVNVERAQEVLMHKKLLHMAHDPTTRPAFEARLIQVWKIINNKCINVI